MRILYTYTSDYTREIRDCEAGVVPSHRAWGYLEAKGMDHEPFICGTPRLLRSLLRRPVVWRIYQAVFAFRKQRTTDCIIAINEASAIPVLALKWLGLLKTPLVLVSTGLMNRRNRSGKRKTMWMRLLPHADAIVSLSSMERDATWREFGLREDRQFLVNMLVDTKYFRRADMLGGGDYCLSAGTNEGRDYPTLLKAFPRSEKLVVVTDSYNAEIIERTREPGQNVEVLQGVPIQKLKSLYEGAKAVINPINECDFASGHTILLENMALGRPVIVSMVRGMKDYFEDGVTAIGVKPYDVEDMRQKIESYLESPDRYKQIGERAVEWVRGFSSVEFTKKVLRIAEGTVSRPFASAELQKA